MASDAVARKVEIVGLVRRLRRDFERLAVLSKAEGHAFIHVPELSKEQQPEQIAEGASTSEKAVGVEERAENGSMDGADNQSLPKDGVPEPPLPVEDHAVEGQRLDQIGWCSPSIKGYEWVLSESVRSAVRLAAKTPLKVTNNTTRGLLTSEQLSKLVKIYHVDFHPLVAAVMDALNEMEGTKKNNPRSKVMKNEAIIKPRWFPGPPEAYAARVQDMKLPQLFSVLDAIIDYIRGRWEDHPRWDAERINLLRSKVFKEPTWDPLVNNLGTWAGVKCFFDALVDEAASLGPKPSGPALAAQTDAALHTIWEGYVKKQEEKAEKRKRQRQEPPGAALAPGGVGPMPGLSPSVGTPLTPAYQERHQPSDLTGNRSGDQRSLSSVSHPNFPSQMVESQPAPHRGRGAKRTPPVSLTMAQTPGSHYPPGGAAPYRVDAMDEDQEGSSRGGAHFGPRNVSGPPEEVLKELSSHHDLRLETETVPLSRRPVPNAQGGPSVGARRSGGRKQRAQEREGERLVAPPGQQLQGQERSVGVYQAEQQGFEQLLAPPRQVQQGLEWHHQAQERGPEHLLVPRMLQQPGLEGSVGVHRVEQRGFERPVVPPEQQLEWAVAILQAQEREARQLVAPPTLQPPGLELAVGSPGLPGWGPEHLLYSTEQQWRLPEVPEEFAEPQLFQNEEQENLFVNSLLESSDQAAANLFQQEDVQNQPPWGGMGGGLNDVPAALSPSESLRRDLAPLLATAVRRAEARNRNVGQARQELPGPTIPSPRTLQRMNAMNPQQRMVDAVVPVERAPNRLFAPNISPATSLVKREPKASSPKRRLALPAGFYLQKLVAAAELLVKRGFGSEVSNRDKQNAGRDPPVEQDSPGPNRAHSAPPELLQARLEERSPRTGRRRRRASTGGSIPSPEGWQETTEPFPVPGSSVLSARVKAEPIMEGTESETEPCEDFPMRREVFQEQGLGRGGVNLPTVSGVGVNGGVQAGVNSPTVGRYGVSGDVQAAGASGVQDRPSLGLSPEARVHTSSPTQAQDGVKAEVRTLLASSDSVPVSETVAPVMKSVQSARAPESTAGQAVANPSDGADAVSGRAGPAADGPDGNPDATDAGSSVGADAPTGGAEFVADGTDDSPDDTDANLLDGSDALTGGADPVVNGTDGSSDGSQDGTDAYSDESLDGEESSDGAEGTERFENGNRERFEYSTGVSNGAIGERKARADKPNASGATAELGTSARAPQSAGRREHPGAAARTHQVDIAAAREKTPRAKQEPRANGLVAGVSEAAATNFSLGRSLEARIVQKERRAAELEDFIAVLERRMAALWTSATDLSAAIGPAESDGWETPSSVLQGHPTAESATPAAMRSPLGHK